MYRIILVDDEDEVREGIKAKTSWKECGFELVGDFENGRDAWEAMEGLKPDAVITDICMPFMDGLELTRRVYESYRNVKVAIVTGFEDFDYAQRAIKLKVNDYLLKPLNSQEFTDYLRRMKQELDEDHDRKQNLNRLQSQLHQSLPLLKERFLEKFSCGTTTGEERTAGIAAYADGLRGPYYASIVGDLDEPGGVGALSDTDLELHRFGVYNIMQEIIEPEGHGIVFRTRDHKVAAFLSVPESLSVLEAERLAGHVRRSVEKYLKRTLSIGIGRPAGSIAELPGSFREALSALDYRFMLGKNRTLSIQDVEFGRRTGYNPDNEWEKKLISAMRTGSRECVSKAIKSGISELKSSGLSADEVYGHLNKLIAALINWVAETGLEPESAPGNESFSVVRGLSTLDDIEAWLAGKCGRILAELSAKRSSVTHTQMLEAERYIGEQFMNEDLTLTDVCGHLYMSTSYFSSLFKQHTGTTFVEYLTRLRIDRAKQLLSITSHKTYEIALKVGYGDPHYFSVIFKRHTGMTPKEYRAAQKGIS